MWNKIFTIHPYHPYHTPMLSYDSANLRDEFNELRHQLILKANSALERSSKYLRARSKTVPARAACTGASTNRNRILAMAAEQRKKPALVSRILRQDWRWITKPILSECIWFIEWMKQLFGIHKVSGSHPQPEEQTGTGWKVHQLTIHAVDASLSYGQSRTWKSLLSKFSHCTFIMGKLTKSTISGATSVPRLCIALMDLQHLGEAHHSNGLPMC